ncbi:MAG: protein phosphatase 2C domain-containing protein, partial [Corynebacterium variabile]|uniref:protein phosphatase 2C domain-containing protein n=1 Tax=Corynebacterium variabile TaxID=1727 RepID=UPI00264873F1
MRLPAPITDIIVGAPGPDIIPVAVEEKFGAGDRIPDTVIDGWENDDLIVRATSVRGRMHRYNGAPRQDSIALQRSMDGATVFIAVADGVSAAVHSHAGSQAAAMQAVAWLEKNYTVGMGDAEARNLLQNAAYAVSSKAGAGKFADALPDDFASTLVCAAVTRTQEGLAGHVFSVGDSCSWILDDAGILPIAGGKEDYGAVASSAVRPLPYLPDVLDVQGFVTEGAEVLLLASDG